jgi:hypothetical protein
MKPVIQFILTLWFALSVVLGLISVLKNETLNPYVQIFLWLFSPVLLINGAIFVKRERKKLYFQKLKSQLFT